MKINSIRISNILSFEHKDNIDDCQEIKFKDDINVIIGPNGSGKSNFLEILNQLFSTALFQPYEFAESHINSFKAGKGDKSTLVNTVKKQGKEHTLLKNHNSTKNVKTIKIEIGLNNNDRENLVFIRDNLTKIHEYISKYAWGSVQFPEDTTPEQLKNRESIIIVFEDLNNQKHFANITNMTGDFLFTWFYINHFNLLQHIIYLANREEGENWPLLKNTFALMSSYRNYNSITSNFDVQQNEVDHLNSLKLNLINDSMLHSTEKEPTVFAYVKCLIGYSFHRMLVNRGLERYKNMDPIEDFTDELFLNINEILSKTIGLKLYLKRNHPNSQSYQFSFINVITKKDISINELSSGEKGLIYFVLAVYGHDLKNGVMIIDEPEIHLHPQMQEMCLEILDNIQSILNTQLIIVTHSPIFASSKTMDGLIRFHRDNDGYTRAILPDNRNQVHDLVRFLDYRRANKVLFSDKVVLVEGDSDEYFYQFYFSKYREAKPEIKNLEFLHICGKDYYKDWKKFFDDWKIKTCFIRDLDGFGGTVQEIERKYNEGVFILKQGKLEDYLGISNKKLESVLDFCKNGYESWKENSQFSDKVAEINHIIESVYSY